MQKGIQMKSSNKKIDKKTLTSVICSILQDDSVETQDDLCLILKKRGIKANQAMISRILNRLGAIKMNEEDKIVYRLPAELMSITTKSLVGQLVLGVSHNGNMIVIHTLPGSAHLVARMLDQQKKIGILGTIAGDDTIFVALKDLTKIQTLVEKISKKIF